ncbi:restriction endonuclease [Flavobacteriaceae bacterium TK19130]|nr:restriction endonuclease [Thermobacterium salinum]
MPGATNIVKASGDRVPFSEEKLKASLRRSGADEATVTAIAATVQQELYEGISTREIYNRAFALLRQKRSHFASKYKLKKAIYELGPTGFPFEEFIGQLFLAQGFHVSVGVSMEGACVAHEIDVLAKKRDKMLLAECKFHSDEGLKCDVKIPLYIFSRFQDIRDKSEAARNAEGWVITNTRFSEDAEAYATCKGLKLLSWDYPKDKGLKDTIDRLGLYPITVSHLLSQREKQFLLGRSIVLVRQLLKATHYLDHLGVSEKRKSRILSEMKALCNQTV